MGTPAALRRSRVWGVGDLRCLAFRFVPFLWVPAAGVLHHVYQRNDARELGMRVLRVLVVSYVGGCGRRETGEGG